MTRRWPTALLIAVAACGSSPAPRPVLPSNVDAPAAELDPPCPPAGDVALPADSHLHCRELPFDVVFPAGTHLVRRDADTMAMFMAQLDQGVLAILVEPRVDMTDLDKLPSVLDATASALAADSVRTPIDIPLLKGATVARGLAFTTPDGGAGVIRGYYVHNWLVAIVAGGRDATTTARPDRPVGERFLASLRLRPLPGGTVPVELAGVTIQIPATAWPAGSIPGDELAREARWYVVPDRGVAFGIRVLDARNACGAIRLTTATELSSLIDQTFLGDGLTSDRAEHTARGAYFEATDRGHAMASAIVCAEPAMVQLIGVGDPPHARLRALVDEVAATVPAPRP